MSSYFSKCVVLSGGMLLMLAGLYRKDSVGIVGAYFLAACAGFVATKSPCAINAMHTIIAPRQTLAQGLANRFFRRIVIKQGAFSLGCILGAAVTGILCAILGQLFLNNRGLFVAGVSLVGGAVAVIYAAAEILGWRVPLPSSPWRVPRQWIAYGSPLYEMRFGLCLGLGFPTLVPYVGVYLLLTFCFVNANIWQAVTLMSIFALGRILPMIFTQTAVQTSPISTNTIVRVFERLMDTPKLRMIRAYGLLVVAGALMARISAVIS